MNLRSHCVAMMTNPKTLIHTDWIVCLNDVRNDYENIDINRNSTRKTKCTMFGVSY